MVYIGDLGGWLNALNASDGKKLWAFKDQRRDQIIASRGRRSCFDWLLRRESLLPLGARRFVEVEVQDEWTGALDSRYRRRNGFHRGLRRNVSCHSDFGWQRGIQRFVRSIHRSVACIARSGSAFYGTFDNEVLEVNLEERKIAWRYEHPQRKFPFYSSAAVTSTRVVVGGRDKLVHGLTLDGKAAWTFATRARVESSPAIAGGRVFVGSNDGRFYVLSLNDGAKLWEFNAGCAAFCFAGDREWAHRDRITGRALVLLRLNPSTDYTD